MRFLSILILTCEVRATDPPTEKILERNPVAKNVSLFTMTMWKMILGQTVYKLAVIFVLYFAGDSILDAHLDPNDASHRSKQLSTVVFNTFVWMQIFNELNNRRLDNKFNVFEGISRNYWFLGINVIMVGGQVLIIYVGGQAFSVTRLSGILWAVCIICSLGCLPWALVLRIIPDRHFGFVFNAVVCGMMFILRPLCRGWNVLVRGVRCLFQPVARFIRRFFSRKADQSEEAEPSDPEPSHSPVRDEESPAEKNPARQESPESPGTSPQITAPPIMVVISS